MGFTITSTNLFDASINEVLYETVAGAHIFRVEKQPTATLNFLHSSPGTGTRIATLDIGDLEPSNHVGLMFSWSPENISFGFIVNPPHGPSKGVTGSVSRRQLRVGKDGNVYQFGDTGVDVQSPRLSIDSQLVVKPTALEVWQETVEFTRILLSMPHGEDYQSKVVICNATLIILVTGFETYTKERFLEIDKESASANIEQIIQAFCSKREHDANIREDFRMEAANTNSSELETIVSRRRINFQNYDQAKKAFQKAYALSFSDTDLNSQDIAFIKDVISYRHKIMHVAPLNPVLNFEKVPNDKPVMSNVELAHQAKDVFSRFIEQLHKLTLSLN